mgnify:CR=1 FL=1
MKSKTYSWILLIALSLIWGSSFILMKRALKDDLNQPVLAPEQVAALRMGIASVILSRTHTQS